MLVLVDPVYVLRSIKYVLLIKIKKILFIGICCHLTFTFEGEFCTSEPCCSELNIVMYLPPAHR